MNWILLLSFLLTSTVWAGNISQAMDQLINKVDPDIQIGIKVKDLTTGNTLYHRNPSHPLTPASNMKLFSNAAALMILGPDYRFQTRLSTDAALLDQGVLKGAVYLNLNGDPSFNQQHLKSLLASLNTWGIKEIQGNIVISSPLRQLTQGAPGWNPKDLIHGYGATPSPVILDENRFQVTVNPNGHAGQPAIVESDNPQVSILNKVKTAADAKGCVLDYQMDASNRLTIKGCVGKSQAAVQQRIAIRNPLLNLQQVIRHQLAAQSVKLNGQIVQGNLHASSLLLAEHASRPLTQLMADTLKPSDNLYADSLYLHAASRLNGKPVSWSQAQPLLKNFLEEQTGVNLKTAVLRDGSGLSSDDRLTADQTVQLLQVLYQKFPLAYEYIAALPVAGRDGTLQKRLHKPFQRGMIRAKTGSMTNVTGLSGYLYTANDHVLAFAVFINTLPGTNPKTSDQYSNLIDALCDFLLHQKPEGAAVALGFVPKNPYKPPVTQASLLRKKMAKWRQLEMALKQALKQQAVSVLYRGEELVVVDSLADATVVRGVLQELKKTGEFSVAVEDGDAGMPGVLVVRKHGKGRIWRLQEMVGPLSS